MAKNVVAIVVKLEGHDSLYHFSYPSYRDLIRELKWAHKSKARVRRPLPIEKIFTIREIGA
jgi:hypothetical protein